MYKSGDLFEVVFPDYGLTVGDVVKLIDEEWTDRPMFEVVQATFWDDNHIHPFYLDLKDLEKI